MKTVTQLSFRCTTTPRGVSPTDRAGNKSLLRTFVAICFVMNPCFADERSVISPSEDENYGTISNIDSQGLGISYETIKAQVVMGGAVLRQVVTEVGPEEVWTANLEPPAPGYWHQSCSPATKEATFDLLRYYTPSSSWILKEVVPITFTNTNCEA